MRRLKRVLLVTVVITIACLSVDLAVHITGWHGSGTVDRAEALPYVGPYLAGFRVRGPLHYWYYRAYRGPNLVISGRASAQEVIPFARANGLSLGHGSACDELPRLLAERGLGPPDFADNFPSGHLTISGYMPGVGLINMFYREDDGSFTAFIVGDWHAPEPRPESP